MFDLSVFLNPLIAELYSSPSDCDSKNSSLKEEFQIDSQQNEPKTKKPKRDEEIRRQGQNLNDLVPCLFPFFSHQISVVRLSALTTLERLINSTITSSNADVQWLSFIVDDAIRYLFRSSLLDEIAVSLKLNSISVVIGHPLGNSYKILNSLGYSDV